MTTVDFEPLHTFDEVDAARREWLGRFGVLDDLVEVGPSLRKASDATAQLGQLVARPNGQAQVVEALADPED